jgi:hypothetical protein
MIQRTTSETAHSIYDHSLELRDTATKAKEQISQIGQDVVEHASARIDDATEQARDAYYSFREFGSKHPLAVVVIGFLFGYLFALSRK